MKILITGANGFVGRNLTASLENIRDGKDRARVLNGVRDPRELTIVSCGADSGRKTLEDACRDCSFVFHLAGVNRPKETGEFMEGNCRTTERLLHTLEAYHNSCPVMLASSIQASLAGPYQGSEYGKSKRAAEQLLYSHAERTGAEAYIYRFPNVFGKWCRPNYNSAVATFCHNIARDLPVRIDSRDTELELLYIDDLVDAMLEALNGRVCRCEYDGLVRRPREDGRFCFVPGTYRKTLGEIVRLLEGFCRQPETIVMPEMEPGSFEKKLYATYLSYLPPDRMRAPLRMHTDSRGSFTEVMRTAKCGQFSVNISKPGITRGQHWHHTKWEFFVVVSGHGLIRQRKIGSDGQGKPYPAVEFEVSGECMEMVYMLPGHAHTIINLSDSEDLITLMWANEPFEAERADTYNEPV